MTFRPSRPAGRAFLGATLVSATLLLAQGPAQGRHPGLDLDALSNEEINELLQDELDPDDLAACGLTNPRASKTVDEMYDIIMCALGNDGDTGDETELDFDDLEAEMEEAGTTLEAVVESALERADVMASGSAPPTLWLAAAGPLDGVVLPTAVEPPSAWTLALRDSRINPASSAIGPVKGGVTQGIRARP
jgi:hypothetical protein